MGASAVGGSSADRPCARWPPLCHSAPFAPLDGAVSHVEVAFFAAPQTEGKRAGGDSRAHGTSQPHTHEKSRKRGAKERNTRAVAKPLVHTPQAANQNPGKETRGPARVSGQRRQAPRGVGGMSWLHRVRQADNSQHRRVASRRGWRNESEKTRKETSIMFPLGRGTTAKKKSSTRQKQRQTPSSRRPSRQACTRRTRKKKGCPKYRKDVTDSSSAQAPTPRGGVIGETRYRAYRAQQTKGKIKR